MMYRGQLPPYLAVALASVAMLLVAIAIAPRRVQAAGRGSIVTPEGIRIESTKENVIIVAGASTITVSPRGVFITGSPEVRVVSRGRLTVTAPVQLSLVSGSSKVELTGAGIKVETPGTLTLKGAVVKIN